jgi:probable phosphoglycerate mutase
VTRSDPPQLWVLRHGETAWSAASRHTGRTDVPLTANGENRARALATRLESVGFDLVLSSPLERAVRTAQLAGMTDVRIEPRAVEWDYGKYEGLTRGQIQTEVPGWSPWTHPEMPGGETLNELALRASAVIERVHQEGARRVLLVAHSHFLRVLASQWLGQAPSLAAHLLLDAAGLGVLGTDRGDQVIERWNF